MTTANKVLSDGSKAWFQKRGIDPQTASTFGIYTVDGAIAYPFFDSQKDTANPVNHKYRGANKKFWQDQKPYKTFYNADILDDPTLQEDDAPPAVIVEGENDLLAVFQAGHKWVVSCPDGAPKPPEEDREPDEDKDKFESREAAEQSEQKGKFAFVWNNRERIKRVRSFVIATDNDRAGQLLAQELVKRLGTAKCRFITWPSEPVVPDPETGELKPVKDMNDVLRYIGPEAVLRLIAEARAYPIEGVYELFDYPDAPRVRPITTGWATADRHFGLFPGCLAVATGIPSHGKTTLITQLCLNMSLRVGATHLVFTPEMPIVPYFRDKLRRQLTGFAIERIEDDPAMKGKADAFLHRHFKFIDRDPFSMEPIGLETIIERAKEAVERWGITTLIVDPFNQIEHARPHNMTQPEYIAHCLRTFKRFAVAYGVAVVIIAHPTKSVGEGGNLRIPTLYDIDGAAHWYNAVDLGLVVHRLEAVTMLRVSKVRYEDTGEKGYIYFKFDRINQQFKHLDGYIPPRDDD